MKARVESKAEIAASRALLAMELAAEKAARLYRCPLCRLLARLFPPRGSEIVPAIVVREAKAAAAIAVSAGTAGPDAGEGTGAA